MYWGVKIKFPSNLNQVQRQAKRLALGCEKFQSGPAWTLLSKVGPPFSPYLYKVTIQVDSNLLMTSKHKFRSCMRHIY